MSTIPYVVNIARMDPDILLCGWVELASPRSSENLEMKAFEKSENAVFFKIFNIPSDRQLILV